MTIIKKYGNRRLYDTDESRYITLDELARSIRDGAEVRVEDAKTRADLTQATLAQIILESRGASKLLPVPLLVQLIRMGEDSLAEFLGRYMSGALELYLQAKQGAQAVSPFNPFANLPFTATQALAQLFGGQGFGKPFGSGPAPSSSVEAEPPGEKEKGTRRRKAAAASPDRSEVAELRRELEALKTSLRKPPRKAAGKRRR